MLLKGRKCFTFNTDVFVRTSRLQFSIVTIHYNFTAEGHVTCHNLNKTRRQAGLTSLNTKNLILNKCFTDFFQILQTCRSTRADWASQSASHISPFPFTVDLVPIPLLQTLIECKPSTQSQIFIPRLEYQFKI